jgi:hypothetical protein
MGSVRFHCSTVLSVFGCCVYSASIYDTARSGSFEVVSGIKVEPCCKALMESAQRHRNREAMPSCVQVEEDEQDAGRSWNDGLVETRSSSSAQTALQTQHKR